MKAILPIISIICCLSPSWAQVQPKSIDGNFSDWNSSDIMIDDEGDSQELDITKISISNDDERLYILLETNTEFDIQDEEDITVFIDADNNPNTGFSRGGLGAEFTYYYRVKRGFINMADGSSLEVNHSVLGALSSPTVTSDKFELAINRSVAEDGFEATMGSTISILVENDGAGDLVPNTQGGIQYTLTNNPSFQSSYNLDKNPSHRRFMSYNVLQDGIFDPARRASFENIITAMDPDLIAFQEVYSTSASDLKDFLEELIPNSNWDVAKSNPDIILATRYEIEAWDDIDGNAVFLVYDEDEPMLVYNVHFPCCDNDVGRQEEIDNLLSVLRDKEASLQTGFSYPDDAPTIITGDFNLVGQRQNYDSFIEGDIVDNNTYGQDFNPDWDGSTLEDANPYITGFPSNYTWNNPNGIYHPGKLDFMFYTGSVMEQQNAFVLNTEYLSSEELNSYNLSQNNTSIASDHLPLIVDFTFGVAQVIDQDGDGFDASIDCNDNDPNIFPGASETCDNLDNNCNGQIDEGIAFLSFYFDNDNDGFGDASNSISACQQPAGTSTVAGDCNDNDPSINPNGTEACNGIDDNCNGLTDDEDPALSTSTTWFQDQDGDGFGNPTLSINACSMPSGYSANNTDCDDTNPNINPNSSEVCDNIDNNCNSQIDEDLVITTYYFDTDMDGFGDDATAFSACSPPFESVTLGGDCDDTNFNINPNAQEIPNNGIDENCDGVDDMIDADGDGFNSSIDCNDNDPNINPNATEVCDNIDNNCNGEVDEGISVNTYHLDNDMDGFGDNNNTTQACTQPAGYVLEGGDCDDASANVYPGAVEQCDNIDNNCDGEVDEGITVNSYYLDNDMDGFGDNNNTIQACTQPAGYVLEGGDCDDVSANVYPGAVEQCDNIDNNCDGSIDEGLNFISYFADEDNDGFGDEDNELSSCDQPDGFVIEAGDCDDSNPNIYPGAEETVNNGIDEDCDGNDLTDVHEVEGFSFSIFPNPASTSLFIELDKSTNYSAKLISPTGQLMISQEKLIGDTALDTSILPKGIYILVINGLDKNFQISDRVIVL